MLLLKFSASYHVYLFCEVRMAYTCSVKHFELHFSYTNKVYYYITSCIHFQWILLKSIEK